MTLIEALGRIDSLKQNAYSREEKIRWIAELDGNIKADILDGYVGAEDLSFRPYDKETPLDAVLLVPAPFEAIYLHWLSAQISYHDGEMDHYNEAITLYNTVRNDFRNHYNRTHMPKGRKIRYF